MNPTKTENISKPNKKKPPAIKPGAKGPFAGPCRG